MADEFEATLRLKGQHNRWARRMVMEDPETGEEYFIFPTELFALLEEIGFDGVWRKTNRGGVVGVKFVRRADD